MSEEDDHGYHTSILFAIILNAVYMLIHLVVLAFSSRKTSDLCSAHALANLATTVGFLCTYYDLGIYKDSEGAHNSVFESVGYSISFTMLSYSLGEYLKIEPNTLAVYSTLDAAVPDLMMLVAGIAGGTLRFWLYAEMVPLHIVGLWILFYANYRNTTTSKVIVVLVCILWSLYPLLWLFGNGLDMIPDATHTWLLNAIGILSHLVVPLWIISNIKKEEDRCTRGGWCLLEKKKKSANPKRESDIPMASRKERRVNSQMKTVPTLSQIKVINL